MKLMGKRQESKLGEQPERRDRGIEVESSGKTDRDQQRDEFVGGEPHDLQNKG